MNFAIRIVQPPGDTHWQGLLEAAKGIEYSINQLGHTCILDLERKLDISANRLIVFNAHRLPAEASIPYDAILFNSEQVQADDKWPWGQNDAYVKHLREHIVWDYSSINIERLRTLSVTRAVHCPIGYWPGLSSIESAQEDIDVLFVGSLNDRRNNVLNALKAKGLNVETRFGIYGTERDVLIARAKVVLNTHYYSNPIWEVFRCSFLLANKKCVVTEGGGVDKDLEGFAKATCIYVAYDKLADTCAALISEGWKKQGQKGFDVLLQQEQIKFVEEALKRSA